MRSALVSNNPKPVVGCLILVLLLGTFLRLPPAILSPRAAFHSLAPFHPNSKWSDLNLVGPDEKLYSDYVEQLSSNGLGHYPEIVREYIERQTNLTGAILPPTRFLYIFVGYLWHSLFRVESLAGLKDVASFFSILTLLLTAIMTWRIRGPVWSVAVTALVAVAPTQIHMSQHALIDGFFTFWALLTLWALWENLQAPRHWPWLAVYTVSLALLVLTKENSFFVWLAIVVVLVTNRWLQYGRVCPELLVATIVGPTLGVVGLITLAGGMDVLVRTYRLFVAKNYELPYVIQSFNGPWHRYLVDLLLVSPVILILAIGAVFQLDRTKRPELFMVMFIAGSYLVMCNVKYGMNLRFANFWDVPLRFLALGALVGLTALLQQWRNLILAGAVAIICALEIRQYQILFGDHSLYELASDGLARALNIVK